MGNDNNWAEDEEESGGGGGGNDGPIWDPFGLFTDPKDNYSGNNPAGWHRSGLSNDPTKTQHDNPGSYFVPPPGMSRENMYLKVDYNWLAYFAGVLRQMDPIFAKGLGTMAPIRFECGSKFAAGRGLQEFVIGPDATGGLKAQYIENLTNVRDAVAKFADKLEVMAQNYSRTDDLQNLTVADVQKMFGDVLSQVKMRPVYAPPS